MSTTQQKRYTLSNNFTHCGKGGEGSLNIHRQCKKKQWNTRDAKCKKQTIGQNHNKKKCNRIIVAELLYNQRFKEPPPNNNWELMDPIIGCEKIDSAPILSGWLYPLERWKVPYWQLGSISMPIMKRNSMSRYHSMRTLQNWTLKTLSTKDVLEAERVAIWGNWGHEVYRMCCWEMMHDEGPSLLWSTPHKPARRMSNLLSTFTYHQWRRGYCFLTENGDLAQLPFYPTGTMQ